MALWNASPLDLEGFPELHLGEPDHLEPIRPYFFFSPLKETPQDPILDAIKRSQTNPRNQRAQSISHELKLPKELAILIADLGDLSNDSPESRPSSPTTFWSSIFQSRKQSGSSIVSWDRLRSTHIHRASTTSFLSEQDGSVFSSAREYLHPGPSQTRLSVSMLELHHSLQMTIIGTSSRLFKWNAITARFTCGFEHRHLSIQERDEVVSSSLVDRFLTIGTLLRRLEEFIKTLQLRTVKDGPTVHALAHALSTVLVYLRESLVNTSLTDDTGLLASVWSRYGAYEDILMALSDLYGCAQDLEPRDFPSFPSSPVKIISTIYQNLASSLERQSSPTISAIFAYLLDATSQKYLHEVGVSVGYGGQPRKQPTRADEERDQYELYDEEGGEDIFQALEDIQTEFPGFFPRPLLDTLPTAQKSLILLRRAQPDHPLLGQESKNKRVRWLWSESDIYAAWEDARGESETLSEPQEKKPASVSGKALSIYEPEIAADFQVFDMEPGNFNARSALQVVDKSSAILEAFIRRFPSNLPSVTPTLSHLTSLVFHKLLEHSSTLSSTLLSIFLNSSENLNLQLHLNLLRSYLLVTSPAFKSRLLEALFSTAGEYGIDTTAHSMSLRYARQRSNKKVKESKQPWAIGISPNLLEREIWPPVGGDLSFFLRTVIVESLDKGKEMDGEDEGRKQHVVLEEAAWRIGFAIRDLPIESGRDKWLNPLCIEALDFLYIDYKPPRPMDVLISPTILSKYQRIFAFILRLFRVECAVKSLYRMTRISANPLFPTLVNSRRMLLHFLFISQSFVSTLSSYVFDTAIGGNFDPFLSQLSSSAGTVEASTSISSGPSSNTPGFSDVFELASAHSELLDRILTACLLRSGQKAVGELLRQSLELVLEFCVIIGELQRKRMEEYEAAPMIEDVYVKFKETMSKFTKVLKSLVEKGPTSSKWPGMESGAAQGAPRPTGGTAALHHLLMRLDMGDWWTQRK